MAYREETRTPRVPISLGRSAANMFKSTPSLEELIWSDNQFLLVGPELQPIVLPSLRTLIVETCITLDMNLKNMKKRTGIDICTTYTMHAARYQPYDWYRRPPGIDTLFEVLRNSSCVIKSLTMVRGYTSYIVPIITELSAIEELTLSPWPITITMNFSGSCDRFSTVVQDDTISLMAAILRSRSSTTIEAMQGPVALAPLLSVEFDAGFGDKEDPAIYRLEDLGRI
ncbi:hypothetical protein BDQ17DRAFT_1427955 [Cyathus striatus]|nr:hypothetical protein BDQ17DRAFT_1427955 [Cyathus striatus]